MNLVPVANCLHFNEALQANGVPAEMLVYPKGGHGFGMNNQTTSDWWTDWLRSWLAEGGRVAMAAVAACSRWGGDWRPPRSLPRPPSITGSAAGNSFHFPRSGAIRARLVPYWRRY